MQGQARTKRWTARTRRLAVVAIAFSMAGGLSAADAATRDIEGFGLTDSGRGWAFGSGSTFYYAEGYLAAVRAGYDAFDNGLELRVVDGGSTSFGDEDGQGTFDPRSNTFTVGPTPTGGLVVTRTETASGPYVRSLVRLRNPAETAFTGTIVWYSDLGSDGAEVTQSSSSAPSQGFGIDDRWVVTGEPGETQYEDDPTLGFVLSGRGAAERVATAIDAPGTGNFTVGYDIKVPAGKTKYLLFFTEMHATPALAKRSMKKYDDADLSGSLLSGIPAKVRKQVLNWKL